MIKTMGPLHHIQDGFRLTIGKKSVNKIIFDLLIRGCLSHGWGFDSAPVYV